MGQAARNTSQEYWRPANPEVMRLVEPERAASRVQAKCWRCQEEYPAGARFCPDCGSEREPRTASFTIGPNAAEGLIQPRLRQRLGLSQACMVFFVLGITCLIAAVMTGLIYKADTLVDWQAVQLWRIEWLLAATAALLAGILLKKKA